MPETMVRIGEFRTTSADEDSLVAVGLGSCVGVVLVDRRAGVAGMAHVMLPCSTGHRTASEGKFADLAVPALIRDLEQIGARRGRLEAWMAGGARMFAGATGGLDIGERNAVAVREALEGIGVPVRGATLGGSSGRTLRVGAGGRITVRSAGAEEELMAPGTHEVAAA